VGLGCHIEAFLQDAAARVVHVVEPSTELFYWSLHVVDWAAILERFAAPRITLVVGEGYDATLSRLRQAMFQLPVGVEGMVCVGHYRHPELMTLLQTLQRDWPTI